jgi:hypothetical protein
MSAQVLFNPLTYIDRLTRGGFTPEQACASAEALENAFTESVATKADILDVKRELLDFKHELKLDIVEAEARLRLEISQSKNDTPRWMFGFNLAMIGAIFAIVKFVH